MHIGNLEVKNPLFLGPMAGVTDGAFRTVCAELGAGVTPQLMAQGAQLALEISNADFIDINMGCPMPKIANSGDGCGLMRTPELAGEIVSAVAKAVNVPVTVKCRLGWDKGSINVLEFTKRMEDNGAALLTVHGRTRSMLYTGVADWEMIHKVKQQCTVPVIANGDIISGEAAVKCLKWTGADGVMIGRSTFGNPWVFSEVKAALAGEEIPERPPLAKRVDVAVRQFELAYEDKGEHIACLEARKHFAWYLKGVAYANYYKEQISAIKTMEDVYRIAEGIRRDLQ